MLSKKKKRKTELKDAKPIDYDYGYCCFCGKKLKYYGNSPRPVKSMGKCCDKCNMEIVVPARFGDKKNAKNI